MSASSPPPQFADPVVGMLVQALADSELVLGLFDPADRLQWVNRRYHELFLRGLALPVGFADILRHDFSHRFGPKIDCGDIEQFLADILQRRRGKRFRVFATDLVDGTWLWMSETLLPNGWLLSSASDITPLKHHETNLRRLHDDALQATHIDAQTGAASRQHVLEALRLALQDLQDGGELSVALAVPDRFEHFKQQAGRQAGDEALAAFVVHCHRHLRTGDMVGRLGGEEFLLVFPGMREALAGRVVERLLASLPTAGAHRLGFSAGVSQAFPNEAVAALLKRTDERLSASKAQARGPRP